MSGAYTHHLHGVAHTLRDLVAKRGLHLVLGNVLKRWKDRVLDLGLDSHLYDTRRVLRELHGDELQDLLLAHKVGRLLVLTDLLEALVCDMSLSQNKSSGVSGTSTYAAYQAPW